MVKFILLEVITINDRGCEMTGKIKGIGAYVPHNAIDNRELERFVETSDEWILERTGIRRRHIAVEDTTVSMAVKASKGALEDAGMEAGNLDLIIVSTISPMRIMPCTACEVQKEIGAANAACFDLSAACSGFLMAYITACAYIESGMFRHILIVGSECLSNLTDWSDRGTCILFGDGAGAAVVTAAEGRTFAPAVYSDGNQGSALTLQSRHDRSLFNEGGKDYGSREYYMQMDGQAVFKFAVRKVPQVIENVLSENRMKKGDIKYYILHQANKRIVEAAAKRLEEPVSKFPMNMQEYGNTSSASIPILLYEMKERGQLRSGDRIVLAGFGGGLTWGAVIVTWK